METIRSDISGGKKRITENMVKAIVWNKEETTKSRRETGKEI